MALSPSEVEKAKELIRILSAVGGSTDRDVELSSISSGTQGIGQQSAALGQRSSLPATARELSAADQPGPSQVGPSRQG